MPGKKQTPNTSLDENRALRRNILSAASMVRENVRHFIQPFGLTPKQLEILQILREQDNGKNGLTIIHIRDAMNDSKPDTSRLVQRLGEKKLIERRNCQNDKRFTRVHLTRDGHQLLEQVDEQYRQLNMLTQHLTKDEFRDLDRLLKKLLGQLDAGDTG